MSKTNEFMAKRVKTTVDALGRIISVAFSSFGRDYYTTDQLIRVQSRLIEIDKILSEDNS